ncbi:MAG: electron transport complex subunit RsxA [Pseudomonadales bacterium]|nr:electron transport complex subunit RsxA [Pseudomonadales bacterium]
MHFSAGGRFVLSDAALLLSAILVNNFVLSQFLGLCPFMGVSNKVETAIGMAVATTFVMTLASACAYFVFHWLLVPLGLEYLKTIFFILVIASVVQLTKMIIEKTSPVLYRVLGVFLPLITSNCAVLGVVLQNTAKDHSFVQSLLWGFGGALGFALVLVLFSSMRERIAAADVPVALQGTAIGMVAASLISLAFMGFAGLV